MDKQKVIVVLLLITIVFSLISIIVTFGVDIPMIQQRVITYYPAGEGSASLVVLPPGTGGNLG